MFGREQCHNIYHTQSFYIEQDKFTGTICLWSYFRDNEPASKNKNKILLLEPYIYFLVAEMMNNVLNQNIIWIKAKSPNFNVLLTVRLFCCCRDKEWLRGRMRWMGGHATLGSPLRSCRAWWRVVAMRATRWSRTNTEGWQSSAKSCIHRLMKVHSFSVCVCLRLSVYSYFLLAIMCTVTSSLQSCLYSYFLLTILYVQLLSATMCSYFLFAIMSV